MLMPRFELDQYLDLVEADELMAFVAQRVAPYKRVRTLDFIDAIPKSPSGKILRRALRQ